MLQQHWKINIDPLREIFLNYKSDRILRNVPFYDDKVVYFRDGMFRAYLSQFGGLHTIFPSADIRRLSLLEVADGCRLPHTLTTWPYIKAKQVANKTLHI